MNKMKIGLLFKSEVGFINTRYTAGHERVFLQEIKILKNNNISFKAFCRAKISPPHSKIQPIYYPLFLKKLATRLENSKSHLSFKSKVIIFLNFLAELLYCTIFYFKCMDCDIFISHQTPVLAIIAPKKTAVTIHNKIKLPFIQFFGSRYEKSTFWFCSQYLQKQFKKLNKISAEKTKVIYNGVNTDLFKPSNTPKTRPTEHHQLNLLYCSAWNRCKGLNILLKALQYLEHKNNFKIQLTIASDPLLWWSDFPNQNSSYIKNTNSLLTKMKNVKLQGGISYYQMPRIYLESDWVIIPSVFADPFPLVALEAMACGKPIIASNTGGLSEIVDHKKNGLLISKISVNKLALTIRNIYLKKDRHLYMGQKAREKITNRLSLKLKQKVYLRSITDLYKDTHRN